MSISVNIPEHELRELEQKAEAYADGVKTKIAAAVEETATNIERKAKLNAPVDTGRLRSSIHVAGFLESGLASRVAVDVDYAPYLEFGTGQRVEIPPELVDFAKQFEGTQPAPGGGIEPQPFLFPAAFSERGPFKKRIANATDIL